MINQIAVFERLTGKTFILPGFPTDLFRLSFRSSWMTPLMQLSARMIVVEVVRNREWVDFSTVREDDMATLAEVAISPRLM
jgi:hypothetical protein